jgi:hypothetical protein
MERQPFCIATMPLDGLGTGLEFELPSPAWQPDRTLGSVAT